MRISDWSSDVCSSDLRRSYSAPGRGQGNALSGRLRRIRAPESRTIGADGSRPRTASGGAREVAGLCRPKQRTSQHCQASAIARKGACEDATHRCCVGRSQPVLRFSRSAGTRSEEHTFEPQSLMRISYAVFCLKKKKQITLSQNELHMKQPY